MHVHDINWEISKNIYVPIQLSQEGEKVTSNLRSLEASFVNFLIMFLLTVGGFQFYSKSIMFWFTPKTLSGFFSCI